MYLGAFQHNVTHYADHPFVNTEAHCVACSQCNDIWDAVTPVAIDQHQLCRFCCKCSIGVLGTRFMIMSLTSFVPLRPSVSPLTNNHKSNAVRLALRDHTTPPLIDKITQCIATVFSHDHSCQLSTAVQDAVPNQTHTCRST